MNQMKPRADLISLADNKAQILKLLSELVLQPRIKAIEWSRITRQTPNIKIGYPGQHLASLISGMMGEHTGARGNDLVDGSEVKSCSRIDQLDKCNQCGGGVARLELLCSTCASNDIKRNNDSKWLFTIKSESDLSTLLHSVKRVILVLGDYKDFDGKDYEILRFQAFEIWPKSTRNRRFGEIMSNYYNKIYLAHLAKDARKTPAPKNFWPDQYQFYACNPIRTFLCEVTNASSNPNAKILEYVEPGTNRENIPSIPMPKSILTAAEIASLVGQASTGQLRRSLPDGATVAAGAGKTQIFEALENISEELRNYLPLRETDRISTATKVYKRRAR